MNKFISTLLLAGAASVATAAFDPIVPFETMELDAKTNARDFRKIRNYSGLRRFFVCGPGFNGVMYGPFKDNVYTDVGKRIVALRKELKDTDIEFGWWLSPTFRLWGDFPSIEDSDGRKSIENKKCPLDEGLISYLCKQVRAIAAAHPTVIGIEDDYTLAWGRGLGGVGACFCPRHMKSFAEHYGKPLSPKEIEKAFRNRTPENLPIRQAFAATVRDSLVNLARRIREAIDSVDPTIRVLFCDTNVCAETDGDALLAMLRAFAGKTRPMVRPHGAIYGAETIPGSIPGAVAHAQYLYERLPKDVETLYECDPYPHNRMFTSAAQLLSLMTGTVAMGTDDFLFYCLEYLDDPMEDPGYIDAYLALKPRLEVARAFIREKNSRLAGVRVCWSGQAMALTRGCGGEISDVLRSGAYLLSKMSLPYTMRESAKGPALLMGDMPEVMSDDEVRTMLSRGVMMDAVAAEQLAKRGFGDLLGTDVAMLTNRPPIVREQILPAAPSTRPGKLVNAFYVFVAGTEGSVRKFAELKPHAGTEVWSELSNVDKSYVIPAMTVAKNKLGGHVCVLATSLVGNRSSGLYNIRKQELLRKFFQRMDPNALPVTTDAVPGIWLLPNVSADGQEMMVMVNNLSGDLRKNVPLLFGPAWVGAEISRLAPDGTKQPLGKVSATWRVPFTLGQMEPEFLFLKRSAEAVAAVATVGFQAVAAEMPTVDVTLKDFPRQAGETDDTGRLQRLVDAAGPDGVAYVPRGVYTLSSTLMATNGASILLHKSAILRAVKPMDYVLRIDLACQWSRANSRPDGKISGADFAARGRHEDYNGFLIGGQLDGNGLASCLALDNYHHYTLRDTTFLNGLKSGVNLGHFGHGYEVIANNLYFKTVMHGCKGNIAILQEECDSHFTDCVIVDYTVGVRTFGGSNRFTRCHVWGGPIREMLDDSINFDIRGGSDIFRDCYCDTGKVGFSVSGQCRISGCEYFSNPVFGLNGMTCIEHKSGKLTVESGYFIKTAKDVTLYRGCGDVVWAHCDARGFEPDTLPWKK